MTLTAEDATRELERIESENVNNQALKYRKNKYYIAVVMLIISVVVFIVLLIGLLWSFGIFDSKDESFKATYKNNKRK